MSSSECNIENGTKYSGHNLYPLGAETQEECAAACLGEPECHFWTHNAKVARCWLKKSDRGRSPSSKGSNSGQKSCGVTGKLDQGALGMSDPCGTLKLALKPNSLPRNNCLLTNFYFCAN